MKLERDSLALIAALLALSPALVSPGAVAIAQEPVTPPAAVADAPRPQPRPAATYAETVEVNVINVEVIVTDRGRPVRDLRREDFEVYDDGQPVEISNFAVIDEGAPASAPAADAPTGESAEDPLGRSSIVIVVDNTFIAPGERKQVFLALERQLAELVATGTQVMVVAKDHGIEIKQGFTTDLAAVETALAAIAKEGGSSAMRRSSERAILREIHFGADPRTEGDAGDAFDFGVVDLGAADAAMTINQISAHASETFQDVRRSVQTLRTFFNSLSGLPGRKAILYVSDGMPLRPAEFLYKAWFEKYGAYGNDAGVTSPQDAAEAFDTTEEVIDLVADASSNRIAFYTISSGSTPAAASASARNFSRDITAVAAESMVPDQQGLLLLARATGGDAATEIASLDALVDRVAADLSSYYSLGYASPHGGDGKVHRVEVRVKRPGVSVRYLDTYRDKNSDQRMNDRTLSALLLESGANPLGVRIQVGGAQREKKNRWVVPIEVRLPIAKVALVPEQTSHVGSVTVFIVVRDEEGHISEPQKVSLPVSIPNDRFAASMTGEAAYATNILMRSGKQTLGVGVRDDLSEVGSTVNVTINVGKQPG